MLKILTQTLLICLLSLGATSSSRAGEAASAKLVSYKLTSTAAGVRYFALKYKTTDLAGKSTIASGLVAVPQNPWLKRQDWISYQHGTETARENVPSRSPRGTNDGIAAAITFASKGYIVVAADGLGLGDNTGTRNFLHSDSQAVVGADMITASQEFFRAQGIIRPNHLFLSGYSAGGQWTMGLQRYLESHPHAGIKVSASFPMDGAYDLSGTMIGVILDRPKEYTPYLALYALYSMQNIYNGIINSYSDAVEEPYASRMDEFFNANTDSTDVRKALPSTPAELFRPEFLTTLRDPDSRLVQDLKKNDVYDWKPVAPIVLIHSRGDVQVPIENAEVLQAKMREKGIEIPLVETLGNLDHPAAFVPAIAAAASQMSDMSSKLQALEPVPRPAPLPVETPEEIL